ncbi:MAG: hypothetical protein AAGB24_01795 [Bacteroidota bacterium]
MEDLIPNSVSEFRTKELKWKKPLGKPEKDSRIIFDTERTQKRGSRFKEMF